MVQHHYYHSSKPCWDDLAPSYATFWQDEFITIPQTQPFYFNFTGASTPDIFLLNPSTIKVSKAGVYQINFQISVNINANNNPSNLVAQGVGLYINGVQVPFAQARFGIVVPDTLACLPLSGNFIIQIPANATLQLINNGDVEGSSSITTCDNGINAVTFNIVRID